MRKQYELAVKKAVVRQRVECLVQFWIPQNVRDSEMLEKVQQRTMKMIKNLEFLSQKGKPGELGLLSLEERRLERR